VGYGQGVQSWEIAQPCGEEQLNSRAGSGYRSEVNHCIILKFIYGGGGHPASMIFYPGHKSVKCCKTCPYADGWLQGRDVICRVEVMMERHTSGMRH
jgi:hypothetical protein